MRCDEARELMHEVLDGSEEPREQLQAHLAECAECRAEFAAMERLQEAVAATAAWEPPGDRLERATVAALAVAHERPTRSPWAALAMAAAVLLAFGVGLFAGRLVWPREVVRIDHVPEIVEKVVEREVPVVEERVVIREVPVVRERIVYRDRPVQVASAEEPPSAPPQPVMPEVHEVRITAKPMPISITQTEEVAPTPVAEEGEPEPGTVGSRPDPPQRLALEISAESSERILQYARGDDYGGRSGEEDRGRADHEGRAAGGANRAGRRRAAWRLRHGGAATHQGRRDDV